MTKSPQKGSSLIIYTKVVQRMPSAEFKANRELYCIYLGCKGENKKFDVFSIYTTRD